MQAKFGYDFIPQFLAANGYVVVEPNPPGSTGRGQAFTSSVRDDWGFKKKPDVLGAIDEVVELGYADPDKTGCDGVLIWRLYDELHHNDDAREI